jgi:hypothetical protein
MVHEMLVSTLRVSTISLMNISPKFQGSDYYLTLSYGFWKISTTLNPEQGRDICWKYPPSDATMVFNVSIDQLIAQKFQVQVWDPNGNEIQARGQCTLEASLKSLTNNIICASIFLVDQDLNEFGVANILLQVIKSGFLSTSKSQSTPPSSPSRLALHPTIHIPNETEATQQQPQSVKEQTMKAAVTKVNPDGTCTIRLEDGRLDEIQFVTGIFQISSQFKPGESVNISFPGSLSHFFPGVISRAHPDGTFTVRYQNGTREMRLGPTNIKKLERNTHPQTDTPLSSSLDNLSPGLISNAEVEKGCTAVGELKQRIFEHTEQSQSISQQLETSKQIFQRFHELSHCPSSSPSPPSLTPSPFLQQKTLRDERFSQLHSTELIRRSSLEKRIEEMRKFSVLSYQQQQTLSHHLNIHHYPSLLFAPFHKEILFKYHAKKTRRQASFVIKRFLQRVIAWVKVVLAVRLLTRNRLAFKRKDRREKAAQVIQSCIRRKLAFTILKKRKFSAIIILKAMKKRRGRYMRKKELEDQLHFLKLILSVQRIYRWNRNQKWERLRRLKEKEDEASRKIQNLFRKK